MRKRRHVVAPVRPTFIDPDRIEERLVVVKHRDASSIEFKESKFEDQLRQGKIIIFLLWSDRDGKTMFTVRYRRPVGESSEIDAAIWLGMRRIFPSMTFRNGVYSITTESEKVMMNMLERIEVRD